MTIKQLSVGQVGTINVQVPYLEIGSGSPRGMIVAGQHGNEWSPLFVLEALLAKPHKLRGSAVIVPVANPFGFIAATRNETIEAKDLNRQFPGRPDGDFASRLAAALIDLTRGADFVIDLHTFSRQTPFLAGYTTMDGATPLAVNRLLSLLNPDIIWKVNEKVGEDRRFVGSFDGALAAAGTPAVFIEMPNYQQIAPTMVERITQSIRAVFDGFNSTATDSVPSAPQFRQRYLYADAAGVFTPAVHPLGTVTEGQTIGRIATLPAFEAVDVRAPVTGTVITIKGKEIVRTGSKIGSIGLPAE